MRIGALLSLASMGVAAVALAHLAGIPGLGGGVAAPGSGGGATQPGPSLGEKSPDRAGVASGYLHRWRAPDGSVHVTSEAPGPDQAGVERIPFSRPSVSLRGEGDSGRPPPSPAAAEGRPGSGAGDRKSVV